MNLYIFIFVFLVTQNLYGGVLRGSSNSLRLNCEDVANPFGEVFPLENNGNKKFEFNPEVGPDGEIRVKGTGELIKYLNPTKRSRLSFSSCVNTFVIFKLAPKVNQFCKSKNIEPCNWNKDQDDLIAQLNKIVDPENILKYPPTLFSDLSDGELNDIIDKAIKDPSTYNCEDLGVFLNQQVIGARDYSGLSQKIASVPKNCLNLGLNYFGDVLSNSEVPQQCTHGSKSEEYVCNKITSHLEKGKNYLASLIPYQNEEFQGSECRNNLNQMNIDGLFDITKELSQNTLCNEPKIGSSHSFIQDSTSISGEDLEIKDGHYKLSQPTAGNYEARINLRFNNEAGDAGSIDKIKGRLNTCLKKVNKAFKGPDGQSLKVILDKKAPRTIISVQDSDFRSNSGNWNQTLDCAVITHEILHLLGLHDEYHERSSGFVLGQNNQPVEAKGVVPSKENLLYQCRNLGPEDSIMNKQWLAFERVFGGSDTPKNSNESLLSPAQFRAVTSPGCLKKNKTYYTCTQTSYTSSVALMGDDPCPPKPKECTDRNWAVK